MIYVSLGASQQVCGLHCLQFCQISFYRKDCVVFPKLLLLEISPHVDLQLKSLFFRGVLDRSLNIAQGRDRRLVQHNP